MEKRLIKVLKALAEYYDLSLGGLLEGIVLLQEQIKNEDLLGYLRDLPWILRRELLSLAPKVGHRLVDGSLETVPVDEIAPGEVLLVKPGEVVPVDGIVGWAEEHRAAW